MSAAPKFTPGPWQVCVGDKSFVSLPKIVKPINAGSLANATLIAAAPDLYDALHMARDAIELLAALTVPRQDIHGVLAAIDFALAKVSPTTGTSLAEDRHADRVADGREAINDMLEAQGKA